MWEVCRYENSHYRDKGCHHVILKSLLFEGNEINLKFYAPNNVALKFIKQIIGKKCKS